METPPKFILFGLMHNHFLIYKQSS